MATVLPVYDDKVLPMIVQPVKFSVPWPVVPVAADYPSTTTNSAMIPTVDWIWQFWERDLRVELINYLQDTVGMSIGDSIRDLPDNYITVIYRNLFQNIREHFDDALMCRIDNQLIGDVAHAAGVYWMGYWLSSYMYAQIAAGEINPESQYRMKQCRDMTNVMAYALGKCLGNNPTVQKGDYLVLCSTKSSEERQVMFVDRDYLSQYLDAGGTINELCVNYINSGANPKLGVDF